MAVYDRGYRGYDGALESPRTRFLVISRHGLRDTFGSRLFLGFFALCLVWPLACLVLLYLRYNVEALSIFGLSADDWLEFMQVDKRFFEFVYLRAQLMLAFVLVLIVGPSLVSADLRNRAMPLYLSRPLTRTDYVLGKFLVLATLVAAITWAPGLILFLVQASLAGTGWLVEYLWVPPGMVIVSTVWTVCMALPMLAIAAWVKWKPWARIGFLGLIMGGTAFGEFCKEFYDSWLGSLVVAFDVTQKLSDSVFGLESALEMPALAAWIAAGVLAAVSTALLYRRVRAFEVVS